MQILVIDLSKQPDSLIWKSKDKFILCFILEIDKNYKTMSGKIRQRGSANTEKALNPMNTNERILKVRVHSS